MAANETDEAARKEQVFFDEDQSKALEFVDRLGDLQAKPHPGVNSPRLTNNHSVDTHLDFLTDSVQTIRRAVERPDLVDELILRNYLDKIRSLEGELQGLKDKTFSLDHIGERMQKASYIKRNLFDLHMAILRLTEWTKKEHTSEVI